MRKVRLDTLREHRRLHEQTSGDKRCDHPGCKEEGLYRAPKSRKQLKEYFWFCLPHVTDYNRAWNFHAGMSETEIEAHLRATVIGERPLWPLGARGNELLGRYERARAQAHEDFGIFDDGDDEQPQPRVRPRPATKEDEALATLGLTPPADIATIKQQYKRLVKLYHPDANGGDPSAEERLKRINEAYGVIKKRLAS